MLPKVCAWITVITFTKIYWILPIHWNVTIKNVSRPHFSWATLYFRACCTSPARVCKIAINAAIYFIAAFVLFYCTWHYGLSRFKHWRKIGLVLKWSEWSEGYDHSGMGLGCVHIDTSTSPGTCMRDSEHTTRTSLTYDEVYSPRRQWTMNMTYRNIQYNPKNKRNKKIENKKEVLSPTHLILVNRNPGAGAPAWF